MTREEGKEFANALKNNYTIDFDKLPEFCDMAISALSEQKPLKERMEQLYLVESLKEDFEKLIKENERLRNALSENKGEWEHVSGGSFIDVYRCSKCKHEPPRKPLPDIKTWGWDFTDFCPNCGADMRRK